MMGAVWGRVLSLYGTCADKLLKLDLMSAGPDFDADVVSTNGLRVAGVLDCVQTARGQ